MKAKLKLCSKARICASQVRVNKGVPKEHLVPDGVKPRKFLTFCDSRQVIWRGDPCEHARDCILTLAAKGKE